MASPEEGAEPAGHEASESEEEGPGAEEDMLLKEFEERRSLRQKSGLNGPVGSPETKDSSSQEVLSELRALAQRLNKENHRSGRQEVSAARKGTVLQVQREEPAEEEEEPLLLQRPERAQTLDEEVAQFHTLVGTAFFKKT